MAFLKILTANLNPDDSAGNGWVPRITSDTFLKKDFLKSINLSNRMSWQLILNLLVSMGINYITFRLSEIERTKFIFYLKINATQSRIFIDFKLWVLQNRWNRRISNITILHTRKKTKCVISTKFKRISRCHESKYI